MVQQVCQFLADMGSILNKNGSPLASVTVRKVASGIDDARYEVMMAGKARVISIEQGVWNPASYQSFAKEFFTTTEVTSPTLSDTECAEALLSPDLKTFIAENKRLSDFLSEHPASAAGHVQASLLLGTIALNDYSGAFRDVRIPLNRMIAHLAAADALSVQTQTTGRSLAESLRLTLCGRQVEALASLEDFSSGQDKVLAEWAVILRLRNTGDWRADRGHALSGSDALKHEYFRALVRSVSCAMGIQFLKEAEVKPDAGYWRIANEEFLSVGHGHVFSKPILGIELQESASAAGTFGIKVETDDLDWLKHYVDVAEGSPVGAVSQHARIDVAGKNLMAGYHQRHLMQAVQKTFRFLNDNWGVKDSANELRTFVEEKLPETRYTPFLKRMMARSDADRKKVNESCAIVIQKHPEMVTPALWTSLRDDQNQRWVLSFPDHHAWFRPEVPRGTVFEVNDRLYEIGVGDENDGTWLKALLDQAPYSYPLAKQNAYHENGNTVENISPEIAAKWMGSMPDFSLRAIRLLATTYRGQPDLYQVAMEKAAKLDPNLYLELGDYLERQTLPEKAAQAYMQAFEKAEDRVSMANTSLPLVKYLHRRGDIAMATKVAGEAAEVYSYRGLETYIWLMEKQGKWDQALETARKIDARYNEDEAVAEMSCLIRMSKTDMATARKLGYESKLSGVFPSGLNRVALSDFSAAPKRGVLINGSSKQMVPFGLQRNMVIVALNGIRTENFAQYSVIRAVSDDPLISLIVWDGAAYRVSEGSLPGRRFGVDMTDYVK